MMAQTGMYKYLKTGLWPKCAAIATKHKNIMVNPHEEKCVHEKFYIKMPDYAKYLRTLGEMGFLHSIATVLKKMEDQGMTCMSLG